jgi:hypothetical protein
LPGSHLLLTQAAGRRERLASLSVELIEAAWSIVPLIGYHGCAALSTQDSRRQYQEQKKQRNDHRWHDPIDQAKLGQSTLLLAGGSARALSHRWMP